MKLVHSSIFIVVVSAIAAITINNYPNGTQSLASANIEAKAKTAKSYILQGATSEHLNQLVNGVGGAVSREFPIINAVSAMLTPSQADRIREVGGVRIQDDRTVITSGLLSQIGLASLDLSPQINNNIAQQTGADRLHDLNITGQGVTIAVVDSGANMRGSIGSPLFRDRSKKQKAFVKYDAFKGKEVKFYNDDQNGHGTHVAGIIGSSLLDEASGKYNGIAPDGNLLSVKAFDENGQSSYTHVLDALNWIFENRYKYKIRVVNLSLGAKVQSNYWNDPINQAVMRLWDAGVVVVSSAGNNGQDMGITVPGNTPYIITVGAATDSATPNDLTDDRVTSFSAKGPTYEGFVKPEVLAYGSQISSKLDQRYLYSLLQLSDTGIDYSEVSGTSQSAAVVTGIVALMISNDPYITPDDVKCRIMQTAIPANNGQMATYSPFEQGTGLVNAYRAVMSTATNCANTGLNIKEDLMGTSHFMGPAKQDAMGKYFIELTDGSVFTEGMHWGGKDMSVEGMYWGDNIGVQGMYWSNTNITVEGMYWGGASVQTEGMYWGATEMNTQGMLWAANEISVKGMYWGQNAVDVQGVYWGDQVTGLQSAELEVAPIDPNVEILIAEDGWL